MATPTQESNTLRILRWVAIFSLLGVGAYYINSGYGMITAGDDTYKNNLQDPSLQSHMINSSRTDHIENMIIENAQIDYTAKDVFSIDNPIYMKIRVHVNNPNLVDQVIVVDTQIDNVLAPTNNQTLTNIVNAFATNMNAGHYIPLSNNQVYDEYVGNYNFKPNFEATMGYAVLAYHDGKVVDSAWGGVPLIIYPITAKLQAETDRSLKLQNYESAKSNAHVEGLTWVIIGLVPLALSGEILIHKHLI